MGELAGKLVGESIAAFEAKDSTLAKEVIANDDKLDALEDAHEEQTIQIIALNQPVASDLRRLIAFLRVNTTIERAGDLAVNISQACIRLADKPNIRPYVDIPRSYQLVRGMWDDAMRSFQEMDERLAAELRARDDMVDRIHEETILQLIDISRDTPQLAYQASNVLGVSKCLERIADLTVDISDEIIYVKSGEFRHGRAQQRSTA